MPQGDLVFFPYDVTVVLGAYLVGYALFVSLLAPRLVLVFRARARLNQNPLLAPDKHKANFNKKLGLDRSFEILSVGGLYSVSTSEFLLQVVQFVLLLLFLYSLANNQLQQKHLKIERAAVNNKARPNFEVAALVTNNLLLLWSHQRGALFYQPAVHALYEATHHTLQLLHRGVPPSVLPRLLSAVRRASKGLNAV